MRVLSRRESGSALDTLPQGQIRLAIAASSPFTLSGLDALFTRDPAFAVVARCADGVEVVSAVLASDVDVLVIDEEMRPLGGAAVVQELQDLGQLPRVVMLTDEPMDDGIAGERPLGVDVLVSKTARPHRLLQSVREARAGRAFREAAVSAGCRRPEAPPVLGALSPRQLEVARAVANGLTNRELAERFAVSEGTIKNHLHTIYERLQLEGRLALLLYLRERKLA